MNQRVKEVNVIHQLQFSNKSVSINIVVFQVKLSVLKSYLSSASPFFSIVVAISFAFFIVFQVSTNIWLSNWTQDVIVNNTQDYHLTSVRLGIYGMLGAGQGKYNALF